MSDPTAEQLAHLPPDEALEVAIGLELIPKLARDRAWRKLPHLPRRGLDGRWQHPCAGAGCGYPVELHRIKVLYPVTDAAQAEVHEKYRGRAELGQRTGFFWLSHCPRCHAGTWITATTAEG